VPRYNQGRGSGGVPYPQVWGYRGLIKTIPAISKYGLVSPGNFDHVHFGRPASSWHRWPSAPTCLVQGLYRGIALVSRQLYNTYTMSEKITWFGGYSVPVLCRFMMLQLTGKYQRYCHSSCLLLGITWW
jgi:hypothetical protein